MIVFIDESGCAGFKLGKGSTPYFVVGMVIFENFSEAERTSAKIKELRNTLRIYPEFKFSGSSNAVRDKFFQAINSYDFKIRALVVEKCRIYSEHLRYNTDSFYNFFVQLLIKHDGGLLKNANIKIDGSGDRHFKRALQAYLRSQLEGGKCNKISLVDSKGNDLIQLADMVTGAIARSYQKERADTDRWLNLIKKKIDNIWDYK